jgi:signal transduction histidine kinase
MKPKVLFVDDEVDNVDALERLFRKDYEVLKATSGEEGLKLIKNQEIAVIISDQRMPQMTGVEFLKKSISSHPDTVRMLLTGYTEVESIIAAINSGQIYRYITKPWDPNDLKTAMNQAVERYTLGREIQKKNRELEIAFEELKTLDEAKSHFMILINHELKTPLTVLLSFLELVLETKLDEDQKLYLTKISGSASRLKDIIFDVLELMNAETGQTKVSKKKQRLADTIQSSVERFKEKATEKGVGFALDLDKSEAQYDGKLIESVLGRLIDNAIKFSEKKTKIDVICKDGRVEITNHGATIDKKMIQNILKPFSLDEKIMNHSKGLGLGLSLSQALLKRHGSELELTSSKSSVTASFQV